MKPLVILILLVSVCILIGCQPRDPVQEATVKYRPVVEAYYHVWNTGKLDTLNAICDPQYVRYEGMSGADKLDSVKKFITNVRMMVPDFKLTIEEALYLGDRAVVRYGLTGTHTGQGGPPPTGKSFKVSGLSLMRFVNGKLAEDHTEIDYLHLWRQLGYKLAPPTK
jgi:predicted ester cyclase